MGNKHSQMDHQDVDSGRGVATYGCCYGRYLEG